jgi:lipid A ethanolaminephosphotransferase
MKSLKSIPRPMLSGLTLNILVSVYLMAVFNNTYWSRVADAFHGETVRMLAFGGVFWAFTLFIMSLLGFRWLQKPVLVFVVILCAVTSFYQDKLGATIDREMIQNVMQTTVAESRHLITPDFAAHVLGFGVLPSLLILWVQVKRRGIIVNIAGWALTVVASLGMFFGLLYSDFKAYSAVIRERKDIVQAHQPFAPLNGAVRYAKMVMRTTNVIVAPLGLDAVKGPRLTAANKPVLTIVWAGETARAQNFGVNGYERDTTPETPTQGFLNFTNVESCGTATAVSLPCMFSNLTQAEYSDVKVKSVENLFDVLGHAGVKVEWFDNNTGDQTIAKRYGWTKMTAEMDAVACEGGECTDAVYLPLIRDKLATITEDTVLVLHMIGSHGPAYYLRYPEEFRKFTPDCRTAEFAKCTNEEIRNAYDNTILFTDHILAQTADILGAQDRVDSAIFYVSDHGESLGEDGLYLHGAPRFMAPVAQYHVPMMIWMSQAYRDVMGVNAACVAAKTGQKFSHDNMYSTVLGMMDIKTETYDPTRDVLTGCVQ